MNARTARAVAQPDSRRLVTVTPDVGGADAAIVATPPHPHGTAPANVWEELDAALYSLAYQRTAPTWEAGPDGALSCPVALVPAGWPTTAPWCRCAHENARPCTVTHDDDGSLIVGHEGTARRVDVRDGAPWGATLSRLDVLTAGTITLGTVHTEPPTPGEADWCTVHTDFDGGVAAHETSIPAGTTPRGVSRTVEIVQYVGESDASPFTPWGDGRAHACVSVQYADADECREVAKALLEAAEMIERINTTAGAA